MTSFIVGDVARISVEVRDILGVLANPTTIVVQIKPPGGATAELTPVNDAVGKYHYDLSLDLAGTYGVRWASTGVNQGAARSEIIVGV